MAASSQARRYRISALLSKGPSGRVYRAVLEEPDGQETDIAIKLLRDEDVGSLTLQRLRDEARLVGQVRDRAIVRIEPPIRLAPSDTPGTADRWALVMDLVTGASLQRLTSLGTMPPLVVCEIVQEVARVLDKVWQTPGQDGKPLEILHRDLKPSNIQLNSAGKLWVLDFGIVKADFKTRDAQTTAFSTGTRGFISPERLEGTDTPAGDVFSLGVTARTLLGNDESSAQLSALVSQMRSTDPNKRPQAAEIAEQCTRIRRRLEGAPLREWAERNVSKAIAVRFSDEYVGKVLGETAPPRLGGRSRDATPVRDPNAASRNLSRSSGPRSLAPSPPEPPAPSRSRASVPPESAREGRESSSRREESREGAAPRPKTSKAIPKNIPSARESAPRESGARESGARESGAREPASRVPASRAPDARESGAREPGAREPGAREPGQREPGQRAPNPRDPGQTGYSKAVSDTPLPAVPQRLATGFGFDASSVPAFPNKKKKDKDDDDETLVLPSADVIAMLETEPPAPGSRSGSALPPRVPQSARSLAPQSMHDLREGSSPRKPRPAELETEASAPRPLPARPPAPAEGSWMLGMVAAGMVIMSVLLTVGILGAAGVWWIWPTPVAQMHPRPPPERPHIMEVAPVVIPANPDNQRLTFSSIPLGVDVYIDRKPVGQTPVVGLTVAPGEHELLLVSDFERLVRKIEVGKKKPSRYVWKGGDNWEMHF